MILEAAKSFLLEQKKNYYFLTQKFGSGKL